MRSPFLQRGYRYVQCGCVVKQQFRSNMTAHDAWRFAGPAAGTGPAAPGFRLVFAMHCRSRCIRLPSILAHSLGLTLAFSWQCDMCGAKKCSPGGSRTPAARLHPSHAHGRLSLKFRDPFPGPFLHTTCGEKWTQFRDHIAVPK